MTRLGCKVEKHPENEKTENKSTQIRTDFINIDRIAENPFSFKVSSANTVQLNGITPLPKRWLP
jgi:hypothetical protein